MLIEIDRHSGFCFGVVKAIEKAESFLDGKQALYCLGDIVHNSEEVKRLASLGMKTINHDQFKKLKHARVLIRAHGEPPSTYELAKKNKIELIDATCPVVLKLQEKLRNNSQNEGRQPVIFGKHGHAEVVGLQGQTMSKAIVVSSISEIDKIDVSKPVYLISQTTMDKGAYRELIDAISLKMKSAGFDPETHLLVKHSICGQVSNRKVQLESFVKRQDLVLFVSGKKSSNGKVLYEHCRSLHPATKFVSSIDDLESDWFEHVERVGIAGATSTPQWLMQAIASYIAGKYNAELQ